MIVLPLVLGLTTWADPPVDSIPNTPRSGVSAEEIVKALETVLSDAIAKAERSVVAIAREKTENEETLAVRGRNAPAEHRPNPMIDRRFVFTPFDPLATDAWSFDYGSGVVIGPKGAILTAFHVVKGASRLIVRAADRQAFEAEIIAADPRSDLAVIAPRESPGINPPKLDPLAIGDSNKLRKGSFLVALGNSFNAAWRDGHASAGWGIVSNFARRLEPAVDQNAPNDRQLRNYPTLLQLDAKLNLGMSGGAVVNMSGELVGLTTSAANAAGFDFQAGYAIPMDALGRKVVEALRQGKEYEYGFLGIRLDQGGTNKVASADKGSPAAAGGVQVDDLILAVGEMPVSDADSLVVAINTIPAGQPVALALDRKGNKIQRTVKLAKLRVRGPVIATNRANSWRGLRVDYTSLLANSTFSPDLSEALAREGVLITEVEPGSEAERSGLKTGQVITRVGGNAVTDPRAFAQTVDGLKGPVPLDTDQGRVTVK
jgi:S1-C subfamily serine protease